MEGGSLTRPAVFLDRDGVLIRDVHFLAHPESIEVLEGVPAALHALEQAGFLRPVVTNQSGIARGLLDEAALTSIHRRLDDLLSGEGASVDGYWHCPHLPGAGPEPDDCDCRKPAPGLLEQAARSLGLDVGRSWCVGDRPRDLLAGAALGIPGILVRRADDPSAEQVLTEAGAVPHAVTDDLAGAVRLILAATGQGK